MGWRNPQKSHNLQQIWVPYMYDHINALFEMANKLIKMEILTFRVEITQLRLGKAFV